MMRALCVMQGAQTEDKVEDKVSRGIRLGILRLISKSGYSERNISLIFWSYRANLSNPP